MHPDELVPQVGHISCPSDQQIIRAMVYYNKSVVRMPGEYFLNTLRYFSSGTRPRTANYLRSSTANKRADLSTQAPIVYVGEGTIVKWYALTLNFE